MNDLSPWASFCQTLMQAEKSLPNVYERSIDLDQTFEKNGTTSEGRFDKLLALDELMKDNIELNISSYTSGDFWKTPISPQENEMLRMRLRSAVTFVLQHIENENAGSHVTLPFPDLSHTDLMNWFLIEWWHLHGRLSYAQDRE